MNLPLRCMVSRSLSLSESAFAFDDAIRIFRRDTVGELSLEFVSGALLSILVNPRKKEKDVQNKNVILIVTIGYSF
jgi:hypothetical protein